MARRRHRAARGDGAPGWVWMLFGLSLGLAVAYGVYLHRRSADETPATASTPPPPRAEQNRSARATEPASAAPETANAAPERREPDSARFEFYEKLRQFEVVVPEIETAERPAATAPAGRTAAASPAPVVEPGSYVLQAGSFTSVADADRRQASLALLGVESRIQRVTIDDAVFHRVRIGPISDLDELERLRARLREAGVDTLLMKLP